MNVLLEVQANPFPRCLTLAYFTISRYCRLPFTAIIQPDSSSAFKESLHSFFEGHQNSVKSASNNRFHALLLGLSRENWTWPKVDPRMLQQYHSLGSWTFYQRVVGFRMSYRRAVELVCIAKHGIQNIHALLHRCLSTFSPVQCLHHRTHTINFFGAVGFTVLRSKLLFKAFCYFLINCIANTI